MTNYIGHLSKINRVNTLLNKKLKSSDWSASIPACMNGGFCRSQTLSNRQLENNRITFGSEALDILQIVRLSRLFRVQKTNAHASRDACAPVKTSFFFGKLSFVLLIFLLLIAFTDVSLACSQTESGVPVCANFTRADVVFSGKVLKVENVSGKEDLPEGARKIRFQVLQNFKGADNPTFTLISVNAKASGGLDIKSGQTWIIYANNDIVVKSFAEFRGVKLDPKAASEELETLKNIAAGKSEMTISGQMTSQNGKYVDEEVEITVEGKGFRQTTKTDADGAFNFVMPSDGKFKIEMKFPYKASLVWNDALLGTSLTEGIPTVFKYDVTLNQGDCNFSFFEVLKK
jgi:hypothetical protein